MMQVLLYTLIAAGYVLFLIVAVLLVRTYQRTREIGFLWLGAAVLVWHLVGRFLGLAVSRGSAPTFATMGELLAMVQSAQQILGLVLLIVAVRQFGRVIRAA